MSGASRTKALTSLLAKIRSLQMTASVIACNTFLIVVLINLVLYAVIVVRHRVSPAAWEFVGDRVDKMRPAYPGWTKAEIIHLLDESSRETAATFEFEPYVEFKERPRKGRYINIDSAGFRIGANQAGWPPDPNDFNIFFFGGSTAFGYLLPDTETIPSIVQGMHALCNSRKISVYNFGRLAYFSTQEFLLYYSLLAAGHRPDLAVFLDGLNDFVYLNGEPAFTPQLRQMVDQRRYLGVPVWSAGIEARKYRQIVREIVEAMPLTKAALWIRDIRHTPAKLAEPSPDDQAVLEGVIRRWLHNKDLIEDLSARFQVQPVFVWQPVPTYKYDLTQHALYGSAAFQSYRAPAKGYPILARRRNELEQRKNFLWLADIQEGRRDTLYTDEIHYSAKFSAEIAARIYDFARSNNQLPCEQLAGQPGLHN